MTESKETGSSVSGNIGCTVIVVVLLLVFALPTIVDLVVALKGCG